MMGESTGALAWKLGRILANSPVVSDVLSALATEHLPSLWLGAGTICGTVWNALHGYEPIRGISDLDIVYFDDRRTAAEEATVASRVSELVRHTGIWADVKNEASVHAWYPDKFGSVIAQYVSLDDAILTWPTTCGAIAVQLVGDNLAVKAPYGMEDLFGLIVRANRIQAPRKWYEEKAERWKSVWPDLRVLPWEDGVGVEGARLIEQ